MIRSRPHRLSFIAGALALAAPALAQDIRPAADPRLVTQVFDETQVYTVTGKVKVQTTIKFAPDEVIQNVAMGDSAAWQVQPNQAQTILFVKPLATTARTNMTVVTNRRTYLFDLVASPRNAPLYVLQFRYPELEKAAAEAALAAAEQAKRDEANALELQAARDPLAVVDPENLNFEWATAGDAELLPARAYDDGNAVFLTWPADTPIPAILTTNADGDEGPLNFTVRGETVVLNDVPAQIILRSGKQSATLTNVGPPRPRSADAGSFQPRGS
ncbi:TrbG/VirB9 family P-type conjugative transfer protein [Erythrobacter sp. SCSIO 43205]|uniref:TrbG/VirB9 family P-type conjugative transfer protein n=1 Tax=Erythrobacter sp. SCSIO 43205 TaxID=2779361 RepID=UPI001CA9B43B|nr:TrbG/VirB9 family P-type conjugative transfer protein [Erythrobacter sp. SCSIO 43205]UAB77975.1 TrbG/VirB9 family P-type conjugative transfer protein [Erythrobacter sp. SCSIO 43205]